MHNRQRRARVFHLGVIAIAVVACAAAAAGQDAQPPAAVSDEAPRAQQPAQPTTAATPQSDAAGTDGPAQPPKENSPGPPPRVLDFRAAVLAPGADASLVSKDEVKRAHQSLAAEGPDALLLAGKLTAWLPLHADVAVPHADSLITAVREGRRYLLVHNAPAQMMTHGQGWRVTAAKVAAANGAPRVRLTLDATGQALWKKLLERNEHRLITVVSDGAVWALLAVNEAKQAGPTFALPLDADGAEAWAAAVKAGMAKPHKRVADLHPELRRRVEAAEKAVRGCRTLRADLRYTVRDPMLGTTETRTGWLAFTNETDKAPQRYRVHFETLQMEDGPPRRSRVDYAWDGHWLTIKKHKIKQITHYQVVPEGEKVDLLEMGRGPFPLPFGIRTAALAERFRIAICPECPDAPKHARAVRFRVRPAYREDLSLREMTLWTDEKTHLPAKAAVIDRNKKRITVRFSEVCVDGKLPEDVFELPRPAGWQESWERLKGQEPSR